MLLDFLSLCARCCEYQYQKKVKWQYNQQMIFVVSGTAVRLYWTLEIIHPDLYFGVDEPSNFNQIHDPLCFPSGASPT